MKRRVFYVVNLDKSRMTAISIFAVGTLLLAFATGYRMGNSPEPSHSEHATNEARAFDAEIEGREDYSLNAVPSDREASRQDREPESRETPEEESRTESLNSAELSLKAADADDPVPAYKKPRNSVTFSDIARQSDRKDTRPKESKKPSPAPAKQKPAPRKEPSKEPIVKKKTPTQAKPPQKEKKQTPAVEEKQVKKEKKPAAIYTLQLGAFTSRSAANRMAEQIRKEGMNPYVVKSGNLHLVRLGRSESRQGLNAEEKKLREARFRPITVTVGQ